MKYHLAQINIAPMHAPLTDPILQDFVDGLATINALADASPGFVWRLQSECGDATSFRVFDDEKLLVNLSVWESVEVLKAYVYRSAHTEFLRRKKEWFGKLDGPNFAMWWIPAGHIPTTGEAKAKLAHLATHGPTAESFTFHKLFEATLLALKM